MIKTTTRALLVGGLAVLAGGCATGQDPCDPNPCVSPPADWCATGVAMIYPSTGQCSAPGDQAECNYEAAQVDCGLTGQFCHEGVCLSDPCDPNPCVSAPADECDVNVVVSYEAPGTCETSDGNVECTYAEASRTDCEDNGEICESGACVSSVDPCNPNPCTDPPADSCAGDVASIYPAEGDCTANGASYDCDYVAVELDCSVAGETCSGGACVSTGPGGVIISEYVEGSSFNKYLEIYNASSSAVDLSTFTLELYSNGSSTASATLTLDPVILLPGDVYVVADDSHTLWTSPGPDQVFSASLWNGNDALRLMDGTTEVDLMGIIGDGTTYWGDNRTLVRNAGIIVGGAWNVNDWTELAEDTHQLGSHSI